MPSADNLAAEPDDSILASGSAVEFPLSDTTTLLRAFLFTDIVGSTDLKRRLGDAGAASVIALHDTCFRECLRRHHGEERDNAGDGFFATFERASDALSCALEFHQHLTSLELPEPLLVRAAVHLGEIVLLGRPGNGDTHVKMIGLAVDAAARLVTLAEGGQILLTRAAFDPARQHVRAAPDGSTLTWLAHGPYLFKGVEDPVEVFEAGIRGRSPLRPPTGSEKAQRATGIGDQITLGWRPGQGLEIPHRPGWFLRKKLGEGGFGEVWLAEKPAANERRVYKFCFQADRLRALKREVILFRLLKESLGARDDIARILDWQFESPPFFIESEYTEGGDLIDWARLQGGIAAVPVSVRVQLVARIAEALAAAHSAGILHKDIKPSNVLVGTGPAGEPKAVLTDFGIGLITDRELLAQKGITATGLTMTHLDDGSTERSGTQIFTAPELLEGRNPTTLTDIYALGVLLYQMIAADFSHALAPGWERDIGDEFLREDIAACVQGRPELRIQSAREIADRLGSLDERRSRKREEETKRAAAARASRRRRAFAIVTAIALLALGLVSFFAIQQSMLRKEADEARHQTEQEKERTENALAAAQVERHNAEQRRREAEYEQYAAGLQFAQICIGEGRFNTAEAALLKLPPAMRNWEWGHLLSQTHPEILTLQAGTGELSLAGFSPDGSRIFGIGKSGGAALWSGSDGSRCGEIPVEILGERTTLTPYARHGHFFSKAANAFVTIGPRGAAILWDANTFEQKEKLQGEPSGLWFAIFSPDGLRVLTGGNNHLAVLWDVPSGRRLLTLAGHKDNVRLGAFSPDGKWIATGSPDRTARIWNARTGESVAVLPHVDWVTALAFNADGSRLATGCEDRAARIWNHADSSAIAVITHAEAIEDLAFSPDGKLLATASRDGILKLCDAATGLEEAALAGHAERICFIDFSPDGKKVVTASWDKTAKVWGVSPARLMATLAGHSENVLSAAFDPKGEMIVTASADGTAKLWDAGAGRTSTVLVGHTREISAARFSHDGRHIFSSSYDASARLWDAATGRDLGLLVGHLDGLRSIDCSPDGSLLATCASEKTVKLWDSGTGRLIRALPPSPAEIQRVRFSPDGRGIASSCDDGVRIYDLDRATQTVNRDSGGIPVVDSVFSNDGTSNLALLSTGTMTIWDTGTGKIGLNLAEEFEGLALGFSMNPSSTRILVCYNDNTARIWGFHRAENVPIWRSPTPKSIVLSLAGHAGPVRSGAYHPDGSRIATASSDGTIKIWDAGNGRELLTLIGHSAPVNVVQFSPDGARLLSASADGTMRLWESFPFKPGTWPGESNQESDVAAILAWQRDRYRTYLETPLEWDRPWNSKPRPNRPAALLAATFDTPQTIQGWRGAGRWSVAETGLSFAQPEQKIIGTAILDAAMYTLENYALETDIEIPPNARFMILLGMREDATSPRGIGFGLDRNLDRAMNRRPDWDGLCWGEYPKDLLMINRPGNSLIRMPWTEKEKIHLRIEAAGDTFTAFIDGSYMGRYTRTGFEKGSFGFAHYLGDGIPSARYKNVVVYALDSDALATNTR